MDTSSTAVLSRYLCNNIPNFQFHVLLLSAFCNIFDPGGKLTGALQHHREHQRPPPAADLSAVPITARTGSNTAALQQRYSPGHHPFGAPSAAAEAAHCLPVRNGTVSTASSCPTLHGTAARTLSTSTPSRTFPRQRRQSFASPVDDRFPAYVACFQFKHLILTCLV